jgi:hypothetical protein
MSSTILPGKAAARIQRAARKFSILNKHKRAARKIQPIVRGFLGRRKVDIMKRSEPKTEEQCIAYMKYFIGEPVWLETTIDIPYCTKPLYWETIPQKAQKKLRDMSVYSHWFNWPVDANKAEQRAQAVNNFVCHWKNVRNMCNKDGVAHPMRFFAKRSFRVRFQAKYKHFDISEHPDESLGLASSFIYIKPVGKRFVRHYNPKTIAGVMDPHNASYGEEGFKRLIMSSLDLRPDTTKAPTEFTINGELYRNPTWPDGSLGSHQINILQEISKVVLDIEDTEEMKDSMGWVDIELPLSEEYDNMSRYMVDAVRLHTIELLKNPSYQMSDVLTPYDATFKTEFGTYPKILLPYYISTDRTVEQWRDERTKNDWRLAWPIKEPGFEEGKGDIITSNNKAAGDMMLETWKRLPSNVKRQQEKYAASMQPEFEKFKIKLRF